MFSTAANRVPTARPTRSTRSASMAAARRPPAQPCAPTSAPTVAGAIAAIVRRVAAGDRHWGTYHFAGGGAVTWHGFAEAIFELAAAGGGAAPTGAARH